MNQTSTTQQGLNKHGGLHSTTGAHGMRAHNSNKTADHHVRHSSIYSIFLFLFCLCIFNITLARLINKNKK